MEIPASGAEPATLYTTGLDRNLDWPLTMLSTISLCLLRVSVAWYESQGSNSSIAKKKEIHKVNTWGAEFEVAQAPPYIVVWMTKAEYNVRYYVREMYEYTPWRNNIL